MQVIFNTLKPFVSNNKALLLAILISFIVIYINLSWRITGSIDRIIIDSLFFIAIVNLLWNKQEKLNLDSDPFSTSIGLLLLVSVLGKSLSLFWFESVFLKQAAFIAIFGIALIASGLKGLRQYWLELLILCLMLFPADSLEGLIETKLQYTVLTAKFSAFLLHYVGFQVTTQTNHISLPTGQVSVLTACTGLPMLLLLLKLSLLSSIVFPVNWFQRFLLLLTAISNSFIIGCIRVALLAVVVADKVKFDYWHGSEGAQIFSTASILVFGFICNLLLKVSPVKDAGNKNLGSVESKEGVEA